MATINSAFSRVSNNLARCLYNTPSPDTILGSSMCGDGIVQGDEVCDCGQPQVCVYRDDTSIHIRFNL